MYKRQVNKKTKELGPFSDALANSEQLIKTLETQLERLAPMLHSETRVNEQFSIDDITLFGRLRGITLIKGLTIPAKISAYIDYFSVTCDIPLFYDVAQWSGGSAGVSLGGIRLFKPLINNKAQTLNQASTIMLNDFKQVGRASTVKVRLTCLIFW